MTTASIPRLFAAAGTKRRPSRFAALTVMWRQLALVLAGHATQPWRRIFDERFLIWFFISPAMLGGWT